MVALVELATALELIEVPIVVVLAGVAGINRALEEQAQQHKDMLEDHRLHLLHTERVEGEPVVLAVMLKVVLEVLVVSVYNPTLLVLPLTEPVVDLPRIIGITVTMREVMVVEVLAEIVGVLRLDNLHLMEQIGRAHV